MAINYEKAARTALRMLTENGRQVQLVKLSTEAYDENMPWYGSQELPDETITVTAAFLDPVSEKDLGAAEMLTNVGNDSSVKHGEKIAFIAANENLDENGVPINIENYNRLIDAGLSYRMVEIHTLAPGGTTLMYEVRIER